MKQFLVGLVILATTPIVFASTQKCFERLTVEGPSDSRAYTINTDRVNRDFGRDHLATAIYQIRLLLKQRGCNRGDINFGYGPLGRSKSRCKFILPGIATSLSCYVESNLGYWIVTWDMITTSHLILHRWD